MIAIKIPCKQCGRQADSTSFILDPVYKKMVCPDCVKSRKLQAVLVKKQEETKKDAQKVQEQKPAQAPKPRDWDSDDAELERLAKAKSQQPVAVAQRLDSDRVKYTCHKCGYKFVYSLFNKSPNHCGYCGHAVIKFKVV
jgi:DNA-directed RNA polymerase subunit RPC12/RpoP